MNEEDCGKREAFDFAQNPEMPMPYVIKSSP